MNTEIDMGKVNEWLGTVRDTFINASELAKTVAGLQEQVNEMSQSLEGLRALNRTLDENLSWSRSERDRLDGELRQSQGRFAEANLSLVIAEGERDKYKSLADERASIIATLKSDNDTIAFRNLELEEENAKYKVKVQAIETALGIGHSEAVSKPEPEPVKTVEPFVHPVTGVVQGRDSETKQFVPIEEEEKTGDKPWWMDQAKESGGSF